MIIVKKPKIRFKGFTETWEQRKLCEVSSIVSGGTPDTKKEEYWDGNIDWYAPAEISEQIYVNDSERKISELGLKNSSAKLLPANKTILFTSRAGIGKMAILAHDACTNQGFQSLVLNDNNVPYFVYSMGNQIKLKANKLASGSTFAEISGRVLGNIELFFPDKNEQMQIGSLFSKLDNLITLHQHKLNILKGIKKYMIFGMLNIEGGKNMPELESIIEKKLIDQLVLGDSQWTYRPDLKSEKDLWNNFRYILEQNNKDRLNGQPLSDNEFEQVKNQLQISSFYKAGEWLVGENGKVMVHVQRDTEKLHLVVMNHEHIAGGSSVYEVINQYSTLQSDKENGKDNNSRFDVTLMINGLPMIHIELKNKSHPYMEAFNQIKRYIGEGKFTGIFSAVQMFVVSNGVDTKYFSAASDTELNPKFMSGWLDEENNPVTDYIDFAKSVLSIPQAHEMIARYTVLDEDSKRLILLRPYQIHAIEAIRESSKQGKSGYVWHTTG